MAAEGWADEVLKRRRLAIMGLLKQAKLRRLPVSVALMKVFIAQAEAEGSLWPETREVLRWFVIEARKRKHSDHGSGGKPNVGVTQGGRVGW